MTVELETPFLFVVPLVQGEWNGTMGGNEKEGEERRKVVRHAGKTLDSLPRELMKEGGDNLSNAVLMMPPPHSHYCLEGKDSGRDGKVGKD